jgi:hypothetical protein
MSEIRMTKFETKAGIRRRLRLYDGAIPLTLLAAAQGCGTSHNGATTMGAATHETATTTAMVPASKPPVFIDTYEAATSVVYLCDASGSMLPVFGDLKEKLKDSIQALSLVSGQEFNVIFFKDGDCFSLFDDGKRLANFENKRLAMKFVDDMQASGETQPIPAIRLAMAEKPDFLYLLSDGLRKDTAVGDAVMEFKQDNQGGKTRVNCIFFATDAGPKFEQPMRTIAADGHGVFKKAFN